MSDRIIPLTQKEYEELARALQWPEDLERWDKIAKTTALTEIKFGGSNESMSEKQ